MANPVKGEVPLGLSDGRVFVLVMDMEALVEAETAYGKPLQQVMADASKGFIGASRALLFGALRAKHPDVTLREASAMFMSDPDAAGEALTAAVEAGFPDAKASAEGKARAKPRGSLPSGKISGRSGVKPA
jgi:hypothetical protein